MSAKDESERGRRGRGKKHLEEGTSTDAFRVNLSEHTRECGEAQARATGTLHFASKGWSLYTNKPVPTAAI